MLRRTRMRPRTLPMHRSRAGRITLGSCTPNSLQPRLASVHTLARARARHLLLPLRSPVHVHLLPSANAYHRRFFRFVPRGAYACSRSMSADVARWERCRSGTELRLPTQQCSGKVMRTYDYRCSSLFMNVLRLSESMYIRVHALGSRDSEGFRHLEAAGGRPYPRGHRLVKPPNVRGSSTPHRML